MQVYTIIILTPNRDGYKHNDNRDKCHALIAIDDHAPFSLGTFIPEYMGGNPYSHYFPEVQRLAKHYPQYCDLCIDNTDQMIVYNLQSGRITSHNELEF